MKLQPVALATTFGLIDLILHPLFHLWVAISPESYEHLMQLFVAGLRLKVDQAVELSPGNLILSTVLEASVFWLLGFIGATLYNKLAKIK
jgi:hypothetical protein